MSQRYTLNGKSIDLAEDQIIGVGGEAEVYRYNESAIKIFHSLKRMKELNPALNHAELATRVKEKAKKVAAFPAQIDSRVIAPTGLVFQKKAIAGYSMPLVPDAHDIRLLSKRSFRQGIISNAQVGLYFADLLETLFSLHGNNIVVGDLNDANVIFKDRNIWVIDADSMQFGGFPCPVGTERFLDPLLYGVDLAKQPNFSPESDYFSFAAMLLASWLYVGPYGGRHPQYKTWARRAEARISILSKEVQYPKAAQRFDILPDDWLHYFESVFGSNHRQPISVQALKSLPWKTCSCGLEHAREHCPHQHQPTARKKAIRYNRSCTSETVFKTKGTILTATLQSERLRYLVLENNRVLREDGSVVLESQLEPGMRFGITGNTTWVGRGNKLIRIANGQIIDRHQTASFNNIPMFSTNEFTLGHIKGRHITATQRIGQVMPGQTWFSIGKSHGFGFYRVSRTTFFFLFEIGKPHLKDISLPQFNGRVIDAQCIFTDDVLLFSYAEDMDGRIRNSMALLNYRTGALIAFESAEQDEAPALDSVRGKALRGQYILTATDQGLLLSTPNAPGTRFDEVKLFADSEPFVSQGTLLYPSADGSIYLVDPQEIRRLKMN